MFAFDYDGEVKNLIVVGRRERDKIRVRYVASVRQIVWRSRYLYVWKKTVGKVVKRKKLVGM